MRSLLVWFVRVVVAVLIARVIFRLLTGSRHQARGGGRPSGERAGGTLVRDPQCGTYIPQARALAITDGEGTHYFCSAACRDAYVALHRHPVERGA
jgi:YHS domain-containing protein